MSGYARTAADVDMDEEAELRRLERGSSSPAQNAASSSSDPICKLHGQLTIDGASQSGTVRLYASHLEWHASRAMRWPIESILSAQPSYKNKKGHQQAKLKVTIRDGTSHTFDLTDPDNVAGSVEALRLLRDAMAGLLQSQGTGPPAAVRPSSTSPTPTPTPAAARGATGAGVKRPRPDVVDLTQSKAAEDGLSAAGRDAASAMLQSDPELRKVYESLVPHALSAAEFWSQRRGGLYASMQQRGFTSRQPTEHERAEAVEGAKRAESVVAAAASRSGGTDAAAAGREVRFKLTPAMKLRIFEEYPEVHQLFLEKVPNDMPELTFWMRYFRSKAAQQNAQAARAAAGIASTGGGGASSRGDDVESGSGAQGGGAVDGLFTGAARRGAAPSLAKRQYPDTNLGMEELPSVHHGGGYGLAEPTSALLGASGTDLRREKTGERTERERREREYCPAPPAREGCMRAARPMRPWLLFARIHSPRRIHSRVQHAFARVES